MRGQGSVEYLVLLAVAIVMVAVGVLSGFLAVGQSSAKAKKSRIYWKSASIGMID
jgi:uncharacterized protein (UPF0333 family)